MTAFLDFLDEAIANVRLQQVKRVSIRIPETYPDDSYGYAVNNDVGLTMDDSADIVHLHDIPPDKPTMIIRPALPIEPENATEAVLEGKPPAGMRVNLQPDEVRVLEDFIRQRVQAVGKRIDERVIRNMAFHASWVYRTLGECLIHVERSFWFRYGKPKVKRYDYRGWYEKSTDGWPWVCRLESVELADGRKLTGLLAQLYRPPKIVRESSYLTFDGVMFEPCGETHTMITEALMV